VLESKRTILNVLFPEVRAKLLQLLFTSPQKPRYVRELTGRSELALHTVQDELRKLSAVGLVTDWSNGYNRFYQANRDHPLYRSLFRIVQLSETLPRTRHSNLYRARGRRVAKRHTRGKAFPYLPISR
jgi:predicted transcriptional regulator